MTAFVRPARNPSLNDIARALGGEVTGGQVLAPGPGHSPQDRSLAVRIDPQAPAGFVVHSFAGDDALACRDYVRARIGWPAFGSQARAGRDANRSRALPPAPDDDAERTARALALWAQCQPVAGTSAEAYLAARHVRAPDGCTDLGFHPACPFGPDKGPALVALIRNLQTGAPQAIQRRSITPDGRKGELAAKWTTLGRAKGGAIRLTPGAGRVLGVGEGVETALSLLHLEAAPDAVWALCGAAGVESLPALEGFEALVLAADHDPRGTSQAACAVAARRWAQAGKRANVITPNAPGADLNDLAAGGCFPGDYRLEVFEAEPVGEGDEDAMARHDSDLPAGGLEAAPVVVMPRPYVWAPGPSLPRRAWLYGRFLMRGAVALTVAAGGAGKSSLAIAEALAMAAGRALLRHQPADRLRVWVWNLEDERVELARRIAAACAHHGVTADDLGDRLLVNGAEDQFLIAEQDRNGAHLIGPNIDALVAALARARVDVLVIDPFVSCHAVAENDNNAVDRVAKAWARVAREAACAVHLVHHARKTNGAQADVEAARGASALLAAVRMARTLNFMTAEEAERFGIAEGRLRHIRLEDGKANFAPPAEQADWLRLESVALGNGDGPFDPDGDHLGVMTAWTPPSVLEGVSAADLLRCQQAVAEGGPWRKDAQCKDWVGVPIAIALGLDPTDKGARGKVNRLLPIWIRNKAFKVEYRPDQNHKPRPFVVVGEQAR